MNGKNDTFELIERYLAGDLPPEEKAAFEERLLKEKALAEELEKQRLTHMATDIYAQLLTKEKIKTISQQVVNSKKRTRRLLSLAAAIAILIIAGGGYFFGSNNYSNQALAQKYFDVYPDRITTMGAITDVSIEQGMKAYNEKKFDDALDIFSSLPDTIEQYELIELYIGITRLGTDQVSAAINTLEQITNSGNQYAEAAQWYLALAYLENENPEAAIILLNKIVQDESFQSSNAERLLKNLNHPLRKFPGVN